MRAGCGEPHLSFITPHSAVAISTSSQGARSSSSSGAMVCYFVAVVVVVDILEIIIMKTDGL